MMTCEPFRAEHLTEIGRPRAYNRPGFTLRRAGKILACGGGVPTPGGYHVWAAIAPGAPMVAVTRAVLRTFQTFGNVNLVATAEEGFEHGCRWLELMGFKRDRVEKQYADGRDHIVYIREAAP